MHVPMIEGVHIFRGESDNLVVVGPIPISLLLFILEFALVIVVLRGHFHPGRPAIHAAVNAGRGIRRLDRRDDMAWIWPEVVERNATHRVRRQSLRHSLPCLAAVCATENPASRPC